MRKGCVILFMLLASLVASAQVPGYNNGGLRHELQSWWRGVWGQQTTFRSQDNHFYQNTHRDEVTGTSYGFLGSYDGQVLRRNDINGGKITDEWGAPVSSRSSVNRRVNVSRTYRNAENVAVSAEKSPLRREVWSERKSYGATYFVGGPSASSYGRRVAVRNSFGDAAVSRSIASKSGFASRGDGESARATNDFIESSSGSGGNSSFGFGEVPRDDSTADPPVGDGVLLLTLMAMVYVVVKRR